MTNESRIREIAYQIWQAEGRPHGQHDRHWGMARKLVEESPSPRTPVTPPLTRSKPSTAAIAVPAADNKPTALMAHQRRRTRDTDARPTD